MLLPFSFAILFNMEQQPQVPEIAAIRNQVQIALAKEAFKELDPRSALKNFIGDPEDRESLAAHFSDYLEDPAHAHEHIDLSDKERVAKLLDAVRNYQRDTLH